MSVVSLKSPIKELREKQRLPLAGAARGLGVSIPELARWEKSQDGVSDAALRDLAVFYGVNVPDLTGKKPPEGKVHDWPFALEEVPKEAPYGTLAIGFPWGSRSYPVDDGVRERLLGKGGNPRGLALFSCGHSAPEAAIGLGYATGSARLQGRLVRTIFLTPH